MGSDGKNYIKFLQTKPDIFTIRDLAKKYNLPITTTQAYAKLLGLPKDSANVYLLTEEHVKQFEEFLKAIKRY